MGRTIRFVSASPQEAPLSSPLGGPVAATKSLWRESNVRSDEIASYRLGCEVYCQEVPMQPNRN